MLVYLNGEFIPKSEAKVSVDDRAFLLADGVYEVARVYRGRVFRMQEHLDRMRAGLRSIHMREDDLDTFADVAERLLDENGLRETNSIVYIQVSRGCAPRTHHFPPAETTCTVYIAAREYPGPPPEAFEKGVSAITVPDTRWSRCDIKSVALLPNVLAKQKAEEVGAFEALFIRDGVLIEGSHTNVCGVIDGSVVTYPACNYILPGITRAVVLDEVAPAVGVDVRLGPILHERMDQVQELFLTGTTSEVLPVVTLDGNPVGDGRPGPVTRRLQEGFRQMADQGVSASVTSSI